jgi:hypothetical protein
MLEQARELGLVPRNTDSRVHDPLVEPRGGATRHALVSFGVDVRLVVLVPMRNPLPQTYDLAHGGTQQ